MWEVIKDQEAEVRFLIKLSEEYKEAFRNSTPLDLPEPPYLIMTWGGYDGCEDPIIEHFALKEDDLVCMLANLRGQLAPPKRVVSMINFNGQMIQTAGSVEAESEDKKSWLVRFWHKDVELRGYWLKESCEEVE